ncbi:hypothetical protein ACFQ10_00795 [Streptomyces indonesiensis]
MSDDAQRVAAAWGRIETWLREHAAASADVLRPPAGEADIAAAEVAMGVELPAALAAWYRVHDGFDEGHGAGILPSGMAMLPLADLVDEYRIRTRDWEREAAFCRSRGRPGISGRAGMWTRGGASPPTAIWGTGRSTVETICTRGGVGVGRWWTGWRRWLRRWRRAGVCTGRMEWTTGTTGRY